MKWQIKQITGNTLYYNLHILWFECGSSAHITMTLAKSQTLYQSTFKKFEYNTML